MHEQYLVGLEYLEAVTALLRRVRSAHPTAGHYEAADFQWWWRIPRPTDTFPQLFWFDESGRPAAAVVATAWPAATSLAPIVLPGSSPAWVAHVVERGLAHAAGEGLDRIEITVDLSDEAQIGILASFGFQVTRDESVETWMDIGDRPPVSPLDPRYRLATRRETGSRPHHMTGRSGADVEERLGQTSLYRRDLDLVILDEDDRPAAYGLFWFDPVTRTALVEPMRTEDPHQRRGLARHVLTSGLDRLAEAGAERVKIVYEPDNHAAARLYTSVGFRPVRRCGVATRQ